MICCDCKSTFLIGVAYEVRNKVLHFCPACSGDTLRRVGPDIMRHTTNKLLHRLADKINSFTETLRPK